MVAPWRRSCKALCLLLRSSVDPRTLLLLAVRGRHTVGVENISVHRYGLAMSARAHLCVIEMWLVVVVAARDHFSTTDEDGTEGKVHLALGSRIGALR